MYTLDTYGRTNRGSGWTDNADCPVLLNYLCSYVCKGKGKAVPLPTWTGPECSRKLRLPNFVTTAQDGGKFVSLTHRPPLPPGGTPGTHFC